MTGNRWFLTLGELSDASIAGLINSSFELLDCSYSLYQGILGSYRMKYTITEITQTKAKVVFVVTNSSSMQSASRPPVIGYLDVWKNTIGKKISESFETGWGSTIT